MDAENLFMSKVVPGVMPEAGSEALTKVLCSTCQHPLKTLVFCVHCKALQPPPPPHVSPLRYFGFLSCYVLSLEALEHIYLKLQMIVHPDQHHSCEKEAHKAHAHATAINAMYAILKDPLKRGVALLEEQGTSWDATKTYQDAKTLAIALELQEKLAQTTEKKALIALVDHAKDLESKRAKAVAIAFEAKDTPTTLQALAMLRYAQKWHHDARQKLYAYAAPN